MKKSVGLITTALAAFTFTAGTVVFAEETTSAYPELASDLELTTLSAYAVNEDNTRFAFAEGNYIYLFEGNSVSGQKYSGTLENNNENLYYFEYSEEICDLAFDGETLVFTADGQTTYTITNGQAASYEYNDGFSTLTTITIGESFVINLSGGTLYAYENGTSVTYDDGTYSALKQINGTLYIIKDNQLCTVTGNALADVSITPLTFEYLDLTQGAEITVDDASDVLASVQTEVKLVTLPSGTYVTNADITDLSGNYFNVGDGGTYALTGQTTMLYLGTTSGGVDILAKNGEIYLTSGGNTATVFSAESYTADNAYINTAANVYSMPYMAQSTTIGTLDYMSVVTVNGIYTSDILQCGFAKVTYTDESNNLVTGYVASNFITEYYFKAEDGSYGEAEYTDGYADDNVILTVCLIIIIVVLIIAGIAYIGYSSGVSRRKSKEKHDDENL